MEEHSNLITLLFLLILLALLIITGKIIFLWPILVWIAFVVLRAAPDVDWY